MFEGYEHPEPLGLGSETAAEDALEDVSKWLGYPTGGDYLFDLPKLREKIFDPAAIAKRKRRIWRFGK